MRTLRLFGPPTLEQDGHDLHISRRKAQALLAYLAVTQRTHSREYLVALLWPEHDRGSGLADLSRMLSSLRNVLGPEVLDTDRSTISLVESDELWVDVVHFRELLQGCREQASVTIDERCVEWVANAVELFQGDFLAGFSLPDCPAFDEWQRLESESLLRDLNWALAFLVNSFQARGETVEAIRYAQRWVGLDLLNEKAQRSLIALYAGNGQRAKAHRQAKLCERLLQQELSVEPEPETRALIERIRVGNWPGIHDFGSTTLPSEAQVTPEFNEFSRGRSGEQPFVGRGQELDRLNDWMETAIAGEGRLGFITGGAGRGKTSLMQEFARRAQESHPDLVVAAGSGSAFAGAGDPLLPFREVLGLLTGDLQGRRAGPPLTREQARRLWRLAPEAVRMVLDRGPQLLGVLVSPERLPARTVEPLDLEAREITRLHREFSRQGENLGDARRSAVFGQLTNVLHQLSNVQPLLIVLDDLQWLDESSIALLFHLGRRLGDSRILVVGAYRPEEMNPGQRDTAPPLSQLVEELVRVYGDILIDLSTPGQSLGGSFVDAFLNSEPNQLMPGFRSTLLVRTGDNPLFIVELVQEMKNRGDLVQDEAGRWVVSSGLNWDLFPARVEAVIARRVERVSDEGRQVLRAASVEGQRFTAEVVGRAAGFQRERALQVLDQELAARHRLVVERDDVRVGGELLSAYEFRHGLFQRYVYRQIGAGERRRLHRRVAEAIIDRYSNEADSVVVQIAHHLKLANAMEEAAPYHLRAGELAHERASLPVAQQNFQSALAYWPDSDRRGRAYVLLRLGECEWLRGEQRVAVENLQRSFDLYQELGDIEGSSATQRMLGRVHWELGDKELAESCYQQALSIAERGPESEVLAWALAGMSTYLMQVGDYQQSIDLGEQALELAERQGADELVIQCLCDLGSARSGMGDWEGLELERQSLELALEVKRPHDAGRAYVYLAEGVTYLGDYEEAAEMLESARDHAARMHLLGFMDITSRMLAEIDWLAGRWSEAMKYIQPRIDNVLKEGVSDLNGAYDGLLLGRAMNDLGEFEIAQDALAKGLTVAPNSLDPRAALLGELMRAEAGAGNEQAAARAEDELLAVCRNAHFLYPNIGMALVSICRQSNNRDTGNAVEHVLEAVDLLHRLEGQYETLPLRASRLEGTGWLSLIEDDYPRARDQFKLAAVQWEQLGHPYDHAQALAGLGQALHRLGEGDRSKLVSDQARTTLVNLASLLESPKLRQGFLELALAQEGLGYSSG